MTLWMQPYLVRKYDWGMVFGGSSPFSRSISIHMVIGTVSQISHERRHEMSRSLSDGSNTDKWLCSKFRSRYLFHGIKRTLESFKNPGLLAPCFQTNPKIWVCLKTRYPAYRNRTGQFDGLSKFSPVKLSALGIQHTPFLSMFGHSRV